MSSLSPAMASALSRRVRVDGVTVPLEAVDATTIGRDAIDAAPSTRRRRRDNDQTRGRHKNQRTPRKTVTRFIGSTTSIRGIKSRASCDKCDGSEYMPDLIFLNRFGMLSSSKGKEPQSKA